MPRMMFGVDVTAKERNTAVPVITLLGRGSTLKSEGDMSNALRTILSPDSTALSD